MMVDGVPFCLVFVLFLLQFGSGRYSFGLELSLDFWSDVSKVNMYLILVNCDFHCQFWYATLVIWVSKVVARPKMIKKT